MTGNPFCIYAENLLILTAIPDVREIIRPGTPVLDVATCLLSIHYQTDLSTMRSEKRTLMMRVALAIASWLLLSLSVGCDRKPAFRVAVSQCSGGEWRDKLNDEMRREALFTDDFNIAIDIKCASDNPDVQVAQLKELVSTHPDVILVSPAESGKVDRAISEIKRSGIPVVVFDRATEHGDYDAFVGADNREVGRQAALYAHSIMDGPIRAVELTGNMRSAPARERKAGFDAAADSISDFEIVAVADALWSGDAAYEVMDSVLALHPDVNLLFAHNDPMAIAAGKRLVELGVRDRIKVIGVDGSPEVGLKGVMDGSLDATILYPTMGHKIMETALALARGDSVPRHNTSAPIPVINPADAPMYLLQHQALVDETERIVKAKTTFDNLYERHSVQQVYFIVMAVITLLLIVILVLFLRLYRARKRLSDRLASQNDELKSLNAEIESASRSKVNFFTNVSHDLRTPLTLIAVSVDRVLSGGNLNDSQRTYIRLADKNARILTRLINQILDFNRYEESSIPLNLSETGVRDMIDEIGSGFRAVANERGIAFDTIVEAPNGFSMALDQEKMERVLYNLISNSFKFTPAGGAVTLRAAVTEDMATLVCKVEDTGRGMSREELNRLFERHFTNNADNPFGSGIGMTIVQAFVNLHGGRISADSTQGIGTAITFTIPVRHVAPVAVPVTVCATEKYLGELEDIRSVQSAPDDEAPTLLVIDDNRDILELVAQLMGDRFTVIRASSGTSGIELAERYVPDIIICDIMMPGIDGLETCRRLKENVATSHVPVLMLTACTLDEHRIRGFANGADMYLTKPFDAVMLLRMVDSLINNRRRVIDAFSHTSAAASASRTTVTSGPVADVTVPEIESRFYTRFLEEFNSSISDAGLSVEQLADRLGMNRVQLYRKLKALTSCSPTDLMRRLRLKKTKELLETTDLTVSEIAYKTGFSSVSYFSRCYREAYGVTPSESRK